MKKIVILLLLAVCTCFCGCSRKSIADVYEKQEQWSVAQASGQSVKENTVQKQTQEHKSEYIYKLSSEEVIGNPNCLITGDLLDKNNIVEAYGNQIHIEDVKIAKNSEELPEELRELCISEKGEDFRKVEDKMIVYVTIKIKNIESNSKEVCLGNLYMGNVYSDGEYNYFERLGESKVLSYGTGNTGSHINFLRLQPGEEKSVVVLWYGQAEHQKKYVNKETGVTEYYSECRMSNIYMKTCDKSGKVVPGESLIYLGIRDNTVIN